jgi:outer membrane autotransporter protein
VLEFAQAGAGAFAGRLFGTGVVEKTGAGLLTFTGNNANFTGDTRVLGGELAVNGLLSRSRVTVGSGAILSGTGVIGGLVAQSGAAVAPGGGGVGMLGVNGNVQLLAGSTLGIQVGSAGADLLLSNGTAQLGGTLALSHLGGMYRFNSTYVLLQADGGRSGAFDLTTGLSGFGQAYRPQVVYTATQVQLVLAPNQISAILGSNPATANQRSTLTRIDGAVAAGYDPQPLFALYWLDPAAQLAQGLDALSGEVYPTASRAALDDERLVREAAIGRVRAAQDAELPRLGAWGQAVGSWGDGDADGNAAGYDRDTKGFVLGADIGGRWETGGWRIGVMGFHLNTDLAVAERSSSAELERSGAGLYAGLDFGQLRARFGASYAQLRLNSNRVIAFPGFGGAARSETDGSAVQAFGELAYRIDAGRRSFIEPFLAASIVRVEFDGLTESGSVAAVRVAEQEHSLGTATLGVRGETLLAIGRGDHFRLGGSIGMRHNFGDRSAEALIALDSAPNQAFSISSAAVDRFAIVGSLDASVDLDETVSFSLGYSATASENARDHSVKATISLRF